MKVLVLGASGIIGQHMRLCRPDGIEAIYARKTADALHVGIDLLAPGLGRFLDGIKPDVIINLAGESNTDKVEKDPSTYKINAIVPEALGEWCQRNHVHLVQVSTQAVFSGENPPYGADSEIDPINLYGQQKAKAEAAVRGSKCKYTIVRPTFVLGYRPLPRVGRANPLEQMLGQRKQVNDRWFSISLAGEVAELLWKCAIERTQGILHIGDGRFTRYDLARRIVGKHSIATLHESFPDIAPRPRDTSYSMAGEEILDRLDQVVKDSEDELLTRAREIALFLGKNETECINRLRRGWAAIHNDVSADWNAANPKTDEEILDWYRRTESYIWELSYYHADPGWNYAGKCRGIAEYLKNSDISNVLCLGDGIGDLTISLIERGFNATYHDLKGSRTAEFAAFRSWAKLGGYMPMRLSEGWAPDLGYQKWDAIASLDFLEHVTDVPAWCEAIKAALKPGGVLVAQNAFGIGSGEHGSMPMHLARNDRFEKDWDPLLSHLGFVQESSNWYKVPA